jgi:hypothetical protein
MTRNKRSLITVPESNVAAIISNIYHKGYKISRNHSSYYWQLAITGSMRI